MRSRRLALTLLIVGSLGVLGSCALQWASATVSVLSGVGTLGVMMGNWIVFWVGVGLVVVGAIVGKVMQMMGLGQPQHV